MNEQLTTQSSAHADGKRAQRIVYPENPRYRRIRSWSVLMDQSIVLPSGYRIGLDPLLGVLPGLGDVVGMVISFYLVYESARLGLQKKVLAKMMGNLAVEALVGTFPVLGDIFDAVWKANIRNLRLLDQHYNPATPERPARQIVFWLAAAFLALVFAAGTAFFFVAQFLLAVARALFGG